MLLCWERYYPHINLRCAYSVCQLFSLLLSTANNGRDVIIKFLLVLCTYVYSRTPSLRIDQ